MIEFKVAACLISIFFSLQCSFLPKFSIHIETKYEDNKGSNDNVSVTSLKIKCEIYIKAFVTLHIMIILVY